MSDKYKISDRLKKNLPQFQQNNKNLDEFLEAAGDFLEKIKEGIEAFDYQKDYEQARLRNVEFFTHEMGIDLPRALPESIKRKILRDIAELNLKQGTNDDLEHTLRLIGFSAEVRNAWLPAPREFRKGYLQDIVTGEKSRYDVDGYVYTNFLYGKEVVKDNGTFFEGYRFSDGLQEDKFENVPILGEKYKELPDNFIPVSKTPYIIVRIDEGDFNVNTGSYVDPDTGEVYEYTFQEEFDLVSEIIRYFTSGGRRPSNLRIVIVVTLQSAFDVIGGFDDTSLEQTLTYNDYGDDVHDDSFSLVETSLEQTFTFNDDGGDIHDDSFSPVDASLEQTFTFNDGDGDIHDDSFSLVEEVTRSSTVMVNNTLIGNKFMSIGEEIPYSAPLIVISSPEIGEGGGEVTPLLNWSLITNNQNFYLNESYPFVPIRALTDLSFAAPIDTDIEVYVTNKHEDPQNETLLNTVNAGDSFNYSFSDSSWGFVKLRPVVPELVDSVPVTFTMNPYNQEVL